MDVNPVPQKTPYLRVEVMVQNSLQAKCPNVTEANLWYGVNLLASAASKELKAKMRQI